MSHWVSLSLSASPQYGICHVCTRFFFRPAGRKKNRVHYEVEHDPKTVALIRVLLSQCWLSERRGQLAKRAAAQAQRGARLVRRGRLALQLARDPHRALDQAGVVLDQLAA